MNSNWNHVFAEILHLNLEGYALVSENGEELYGNGKLQGENAFYQNVLQTLRSISEEGNFILPAIQLPFRVKSLSGVDMYENLQVFKIHHKHSPNVFMGVSKYQKYSLIAEKLSIGIFICLIKKPLLLRHVFSDIERFCDKIRHHV